MLSLRQADFVCFGREVGVYVFSSYVKYKREGEGGGKGREEVGGGGL